MFDVVENPRHYTDGRYECIDVMCEELGVKSVMDFCLCNAFKYIWRCKQKHNTPVEDIRKAIWYLEKWVELYGKDDSNNETV